MHACMYIYAYTVCRPTSCMHVCIYICVYTYSTGTHMCMYNLYILVDPVYLVLKLASAFHSIVYKSSGSAPLLIFPPATRCCKRRGTVRPSASATLASTC